MSYNFVELQFDKIDMLRLSYNNFAQRYRFSIFNKIFYY